MAEPEAARVAILLVNYKTAEMTLEGLDQLIDCVGHEHAILLLDNGSGPEEEATLRSWVGEHPAVELTCLGSNRGYCAAMNIGIEWAGEQGTSYVLFLNNDVRVENGFLSTMVEVLGNDSQVAGVVPTVLRPDGKVWSQGAEIGFCPNLNRLLGEGRQAAPRGTGPRSVGYLPGACALYRLDDLQAVQGLDEEYFMYFEDALLGQLLRDRGRVLLWLPWVRVVHDASSSSGRGRTPLRKYMTAVNSMSFLKNRFSFKLWVAFLLFDCLGLPLAYLTGGLRAGWAKTVGIWDGIRGHRISATDVARWMAP